MTACASPVDTAESQRSVVQGFPTEGDPAVVAILHRRGLCDEPGIVECSGTLIAPRVVLTAAHCTEPLARGQQFEVFFGSRLGEATGTYRLVSGYVVHPLWQNGARHASTDYDVALLRLSEPVDVEPVALPSATLYVGVAGLPARGVGFGLTMSDERTPDGRKREGAMTVFAVAEADFTTIANPAMTCRGDSGGPVFVTLEGREQLLGVTVSGDGGCTEFAKNMRLDVIVDDFIQPFLDEVATWPIEGYGGTDPSTWCEAECQSDADCGALHVCATTFDGHRRCTSPALPPGAYGGVCGPSQCEGDGVCARFWSHGPTSCRCHDPCFVPPSPGGGGCTISVGSRRL